jgi:hypothetical protein
MITDSDRWSAILINILPLLLLAVCATARAEEPSTVKPSAAAVEETETVAPSGFDPRAAEAITSRIIAGEYVGRDPDVPDGGTIPVDRKRPPGKPNDWTLLFYDDADFLGLDPLLDFARAVYSTDNLDVIALQDTLEAPAYLWHLPGRGETTLLESLGEVDMGHHVTLRDFILYGKENFPAKRYILMAYDHGAGFQGACIDETTDPVSMLSMDDFQVALRESGGVDILAFTAPCLMGAIESVYELRGLVDAYIGSEDTSGFSVWRGTLDDCCDLLVDSDELSSEEIAARIVLLTEDNWADGTMAAFSPSAIAGMAHEFDDLAAYLTENVEELRPSIAVALINTWLIYPDDFPFTVDFVSAVESLAAFVPDDFVQAKAGEILALYDQALLAEWHGDNQLGAHGLSIYYPGDASTCAFYDPFYTDISLDFADLLGWDEFLRAYYEVDSTAMSE